MDFEEHQNKEYYKEVKETKTGFQPQISFCREKEGNILADGAALLNTWTKYFLNVMNKDTEDLNEGSQWQEV
jgi:hypothetical protein